MGEDEHERCELVRRVVRVKRLLEVVLSAELKISD